MIACLLLMTDLGLQLSISAVFLKPVSEALSVSRTSFSVTFLISGIFGMLSSMYAGKLYKRFTMKKVLIAGVCFSALGITFYSMAGQLWHFYCAAPIYGLGSGLTSTIPASILLSNWFHDKKGLASSIAFSGSSLGNLIFTQISVRLLTILDWRALYRILAVTKLCIVVPVALFLIVEHPYDKALLPYGSSGSPDDGCSRLSSPQTVHGISEKAFLRTSAFYCICFSALIASVCIMGVQSHFQSFLTDTGLSPVLAANVLSILLLSQIIGKLLLGVFLDKLGKIVSIIYVSAAFVLGCLCLICAPHDIALIFVAAVAIGLAGGQVTIFPPYMTSEIAGNRDYPSIIGKVQLFNTIGSNINSTFTSFLYDTFHGYPTVWGLFTLFSLMGSASYLFALKKGKSYHDL